jgi:hypothetical protein
MRIVSGGTYRRSWTWTKRANGVVVPLDADDYSAELVIRRNLDYPTDILTIDSDTFPGLTLVTVTGEGPKIPDGSIRVYLELLADVTSELEIGKDFRYTLVLTLIANPDDRPILVPAGYVDIADTAL